MRSRELSGAYIQSRSPDGGSGQRLTLRSEGRGVEDRRRLVSTALRPTRYIVACAGCRANISLEPRFLIGYISHVDECRGYLTGDLPAYRQTNIR